MSDETQIVMIIALLVFGSRGLFLYWRKQRRTCRIAYIQAYGFPSGLLNRFHAHHPQLSPHEQQLVVRGLKQFFIAYIESGRRFIAMPSQVVDDLWHEFILCTRLYQLFCQRAFGRFLHHTPAVFLNRERRNNTGLRRVWWHVCHAEHINPRHPERLPLLFALDQQLNIAPGFYYTLNCQLTDQRNGIALHCAADLSNTNVDGSIDGFGDSDSGDDGDGSGDGCGGGCGGD